jgi:hypothetical protein
MTWAGATPKQQLDIARRLSKAPLPCPLHGGWSKSDPPKTGHGELTPDKLGTVPDQAKPPVYLLSAISFISLANPLPALPPPAFGAAF